MSVFDLFRGFFGVPGGHYREGIRRDPFFDGMTHDDDDEEDEEEDGFCNDGNWSRRDPFDDSFRFGFSFGPNGMRIQEPQVFGQIFQEMEEIFSRFDQLGEPPRFGSPDIPSIVAPPTPGGAERGRGGEGGGRSLRDFMLKSPDGSPGSPSSPSVAPREDDRPPPGVPQGPSSPFRRLTPFSKFHDILKDVPLRGEEKKEDGDLDSQVSSGGLDQILTPAPSQPKTRSFFQSVTVTKVVKPDGTVEERRTVRDGQGNEETTVTRSGSPRDPQEPMGPLLPGGSQPFTDMQDELSMFSRFFGGFKR